MILLKTLEFEFEIIYITFTKNVPENIKIKRNTSFQFIFPRSEEQLLYYIKHKIRKT
jgi:hypothetical protein